MERSRTKLGRKSVSDLVEYLEGRFTHPGLKHLMFKHGLEEDLQGLSKKEKL